MNYKLAKELKDAGFPQDGTETSRYVVLQAQTGEPLLVSNRYDKNWQHEEGSIKVPTLLELIEACMHVGLFNSLTYCGEGEWEAIGISKLNIELDGRGPTPEEAVAKLWLALNTNK